MSDTPAQDEVSIDAKNLTASLKSSGLNTIATVATMVLVALVAYVVWEHKLDAKAQGVSLTEAIQAMTKAQQEATAAHRETNCLIGWPEAQRERKVEHCKRNSR